MTLKNDNGDASVHDLSNFVVDGSDQTVYPLIMCDQMMLKSFQDHGIIGLHIASPPERDQPHACQWALTKEHAEWLIAQLRQCISDMTTDSG